MSIVFVSVICTFAAYAFGLGVETMPNVDLPGFGLVVVSRFFRTLVCKLWHEWSQPAMEASSMAASRC
ncbi:MAG: hypothetical protein KHZ49_12555, partial [Clostridiales bacterium]|nr:hypothetical protein [Clostridiales bacterium]